MSVATFGVAAALMANLDSRSNVILPTSLESCLLRPWASTDKAALVRSANHRNVWRNLTDAFPHPDTASVDQQLIDTVMYAYFVAV